MQEKQNYVCPICEANCGLELTVEDGDVTAIRGNAHDKVSLGHICPKGASLMALRDDPDRLTTPMVRKDGKLVAATWDEAFAAIEDRLGAVIAEHGRESLAMYIGNATIGTTAYMAGFPMLFATLGTPHLYTAGTLDHVPKLLTCEEMYGNSFTNPVPDIDRMDYLLIIGGNPIVSNGSLWLATGFRKRHQAMQARGGRLVVIDPRRTETAKVADQHLFIRPGTDSWFLLGLLHVMFRDGLADVSAVSDHLSGLEEVRAIADSVSLEQVSGQTGIAGEDIAAIARALCATPRAGVYGRVGATTQEHGTLTSWLIEVVNIVAGNLDQPGGMMFPKAPAFAANTRGKPNSPGPQAPPPFKTRVRGMPAVCGELPVSCLAEEIETPGDGQLRGLITICGNPALSSPNSDRLDKALESLDFLLCFDIYVNETTRHADVILPGAHAFQKPFYGIFSLNYGVRNVIRYSRALSEPGADAVSDWEILLQVSAIASGQGRLDAAGLKAMEDTVIRGVLTEAAADEYGIADGLDVDKAMAMLGNKPGIERFLDAGLRTGPFGDGFGANPDGVTLDKVIAEPDGLDLGPLVPRVHEVLRTQSGKVELAPRRFVDQLQVMMNADDTEDGTADGAVDAGDGLVLIGRRQARSINSWGHNLEPLAKGKFRCTLQVHPDDADRLSIVDGGMVRVNGAGRSIETQAEISDEVMPGVVSLPHGWGHNKDGARMAVAAKSPGVNVNILMDENRLEALTGNAILNAVPVTVSALA